MPERLTGTFILLKVIVNCDKRGFFLGKIPINSNGNI